MKDYYSLGSSPFGEDCVQVGTEDYERKSQKECTRYKNLLESLFPEKPENAYFSIKGFPHDFGRYYEVVINFEIGDEEAEEFALNVENNIPEFWSDEEETVDVIKTPLQDTTGKNKIPVASWVGGYFNAIESSAFDGDVSVECPNCSMERAVEPDANYIVSCEGCGKSYKVIPLY